MPNKAGTEREQRGHVGKAWAIRGSSRDPTQSVLNGEAGRGKTKLIDEQERKSIATLVVPCDMMLIFVPENKTVTTGEVKKTTTRIIHKLKTKFGQGTAEEKRSFYQQNQKVISSIQWPFYDMQRC